MGCVIGIWATIGVIIIYVIGEFWEQISSFFKWVVKPYRLVVALVILGGLIALFIYGSRNVGSAEGCRNCGSTKNVSEYTHYCPNCEESFYEWQKDYYGN